MLLLFFYQGHLIVKLAFTGHRPQSLFTTNAYSEQNTALLEEFACEFLVNLKASLGDDYRDVKIISGMAIGWDQAIAKAAIKMRRTLIAAVPCKGQEQLWPTDAQEEYRSILDHASMVHYISNVYTKSCMQERNKWMVDNSDHLVALWNGKPGGTANCVQYAKSKGSNYRIIHTWRAWEHFKEHKKCTQCNKEILRSNPSKVCTNCALTAIR